MRPRIDRARAVRDRIFLPDSFNHRRAVLLPILFRPNTPSLPICRRSRYARQRNRSSFPIGRADIGWQSQRRIAFGDAATAGEDHD
jgi:hypothetical protein